jgi:hypothetical protein
MVDLTPDTLRANGGFKRSKPVAGREWAAAHLVTGGRGLKQRQIRRAAAAGRV